jgi:hypothetical protein
MTPILSLVESKEQHRAQAERRNEHLGESSNDGK